MARIVTSDDNCDVIRKTVEVVESQKSDASDVLMKYFEIVSKFVITSECCGTPETC